MKTNIRVSLTGFLLLAIFLPGCNSKSVIYPGRDWQKVEPEAVGIRSSGLNEAINYLKNNSGRDGVEELIIVKNGFLIHEGDSSGKVHGVWSMTKSFTSTVMGILIDNGACSLNTFAKNYAPGLKDHYPGVTLKHFTTMTSGYQALGDEPQGEYKHGPSLTPFYPAPDPLFSPGEKFAYWDSAMNEFANVLSQIAEGPLDHIFQEKIAEMIGMKQDEWHWGDWGSYQGIRINSGAGNHTGMEMSALAMARFGYLFLRNGRWQEDQLIGESWVQQATTVQVPPTLPLAGYIDQGPGMYGFNWWVNGTGPDGTKKWPDVPASTYAASGYNNNDMFIIPEWDMVIVRLGMDQSDYMISDENYNRFLHLVGQSIIQ